MRKILIGNIIIVLLVACAGNAIIREYKYSYKIKSADDVLYDVITIVKNHDMVLIGSGNTRQSINTTHGMFFVDIVRLPSAKKNNYINTLLWQVARVDGILYWEL